MSKKYNKIAFPQMGDYSIPVKFLISHATNLEIIDAPVITSHTIEVGNKYSPEFVCTPFKYTLGTLLECLDRGANVLLQAGGGCRYGYYSELQEQILKDLGYDFEMVNFVKAGKGNFLDIYRKITNITPISIFPSLYYLFITIQMVKYMDKIDWFIRENIGFEVVEGSFLKLKKKMLSSFCEVKGFLDLNKKYRYYKKAFEDIAIDKPSNCLKVGVIGELYTIMEPFSNYYLEMELAKKGISVTRFTNVNYLLFQKKKVARKMIRKSSHVKYPMGADAADNICRAQYLCSQHYDGVIHIKSSFCTPEIGAMPIISKICGENGVPVLFFSFDANTSEVGVKTRLEAFYDMLEMRRGK